MTGEVIFLSFLCYSIIGWIFESTVCSLMGEQRFINHGFLLGPYCPIYGAGAVACYQCLHTIQNPAVIFLASMLICSVIEYLTGYGMEKLFHAKWWDYSHFPFQLHGRVCLYGALLFAFSGTMVCCVVQPVFLDVISFMDQGVIRDTSAAGVFIISMDAALSLTAWMNLDGRVNEFRENMFQKSNQTLEDMSDYLIEKTPEQILEGTDELQVYVKNWNEHMKSVNIKEQMKYVFERRR